MDRRNIQQHRPADAIDINDFVHTATGMRVRRLTLPDGTHWFPAVDLASGLGYVNTRQAVLHHVAMEHTAQLDDLARSVYGVGTSRKIAGHGLKKSMRMVNLQGLVALVNGSTKPEARPFKAWVSEVVVTVQREGSYSLEKAEAQPVTAYAMPQQVADVIVRLEELNVRSDRRLAEAQEEANRARWEGVAAIQDVARNMSRLVDSLERLPRQRKSLEQPSTSAQELLESWRSRLTVTEDVWAVAVLLAPALAESGEARYGVEEIAAGTGLTTARVHDCLRFLIKRQCIRQIGAVLNTPVYGLPQA
ncbi:Bro-N domain-containing protein [Streptomyces sp. DSM 44918]|uniref:Bro-N domain-containing protein n=2 Tax=Streptomyces millisiae TaxID=3075542 RepID=A0ABU2LRF4_9ACTN|nr:Bro-N domain-containing protein [Streptomyces sp. DSM 44918]MDT0320169.1 Bro-N domain-containing protein [Streptomyces sp. DSM 44918]